MDGGDRGCGTRGGIRGVGSEIRSLDGNLNYISWGDDVGVGSCKRVGPANKKSF